MSYLNTAQIKAIAFNAVGRRNGVRYQFSILKLEKIDDKGQGPAEAGRV